MKKLFSAMLVLGLSTALANAEGDARRVLVQVRGEGAFSPRQGRACPTPLRLIG